ncbi:MAG: carbamate kinase [Helcococcus sp.]|nr:carbamate kinase [Helcococcus sp.]
MKRIVMALGGNALGNIPQEQMEAVKITAKVIVDLAQEGNQLIITHGNGPQVGMINLAMEKAAEFTDKIPNMPFAECGAMSQGYIGYHLQNAIKNELNIRNLNTSVATIITQVLVDKNDEAFNNPTKPIGAFYNKEQALEIEKLSNYKFKEDSGRGYRRVVASPKPIDIIEKKSIIALIEQNAIVISCGGGGIPVIEEKSKYKGVDAVIDKDFTSSKLAQLVDADLLIILTAVEKVAIRFGQVDEKWLDKMNLKQAQIYLSNKEFGEGSMKPKVEAAMKFVEFNSNKKAIITKLEKAHEGILGNTGTLIINE